MANGTYDENLATDRDWVRFLTGDRGPSVFRLSDEELDAILIESPGKYCAAAAALISIRDMWMMSRGDVKSKSVEGLSVTYGSPEQLTDRAKELRTKCAQAGTRPGFFRVLV